MIKTILTLLTILVFWLTANLAAAAGLSVRIEAPKTPTNQSSFNINFVAMDIAGRTVDITCFKKGPGEAGFSQFGSVISLPGGGSSGNCQVSSSVITGEGSYRFFVTAQADAESVNSTEVSVDYKTASPGTPGSYKKEALLSGCQYKISFKTADDGDKTSRVEIYRSEQTSFTADSGTRVGSVPIGSDMEGSFTDSVPDCGKTFYYAIRAFDGAGNGSGVVGDEVVKVIITQTTQAPTQVAVAGAIPVSQANVSEGALPPGEVLGEQKAGTSEGALGEKLGTTTQTPSPQPQRGILSRRNVIIGILVAGVLLIIYLFRRNLRKI